MKFKDKKTGNILETKNEKAIELMKGNPDKYDAITARPVKRAEKAEKADKAAE